MNLFRTGGAGLLIPGLEVVQVGSDITFLFRDDFTTTAGAPLASPRTAEPGPGTLTGSGDLSTSSIVGGKLTVAAGNSSTATWTIASIARATGIALIGQYRSTATRSRFDFNSLNRVEINQLISINGTTLGSPNLAASTDYTIVWVARSTGLFLIVKGGIYTNWTLYYVSAEGTGAIVPVIGQVGTTAAATYDFLRALQLSAPFDTDYGIATQRLSGARSALDAFTHEANCDIEFTDTTRPSASNLDFRFRRQDSTNYWQVTIDSTGALTLNEVVAGTPTQRATAAGVVSSGHRIIIIADGTTIRGYSNNVLRWTYSSASNFATATAGELTALGTSGAVSDIVSWPRVLTGTAATLLDSAIA